MKRFFVLCLCAALLIGAQTCMAESSLIRLCDYIGLDVEPISTEVTQAEVNETVSEMLGYYATDEETPELTDEFAREHLGCDTAAEYLARLKAILKEEKVEQANSVLQSQITNLILEGSEIEYDADEVEETYENYVSQYDVYCEYYGITMKELAEDGYGVSQEEFEDMLHEQSRFAIAQNLILEAIADAEGIVVTDEIYEEMRADFLDTYRISESDLDARHPKERLTTLFEHQLTWDYLYEANGL